MAANEYKLGNTITLTAEFFSDTEVDQETGAPVPVDPPGPVTFRVYDQAYSLAHTIPGERLAVGQYTAKWVTDRLGTLVYEAVAEFNGYPSLDRKTIAVKFV